MADGTEVKADDSTDSFCKLHGDVLLRVVSNVQAPEATIVFRVQGGGDLKRTVTMKLDSSMRQLYEQALKTLGTKFLPPKLREQMDRTKKPPSVKEMEKFLDIKLYIGDQMLTSKNGKVINANEQINKALYQQSGSDKKELNLVAQFYTRNGGDWNSCVVNVIVGLSSKEKGTLNRIIPPITLVLDSTQSFADLYAEIRRQMVPILSSDQLSRIVLKSSNGAIKYGQRDKTSVCNLGSKMLLLQVLESGDTAPDRNELDQSYNDKYEEASGDFRIKFNNNSKFAS
jgi:hypothetical protein